MKHTITSGSSFPISLALTDEQISLGYHAGDCTESVNRLMELPEIKEQLGKISDEELSDWWDEFFLDGMPKTPVSEDKTQALEWLVFECCSLGVDGCFDD